MLRPWTSPSDCTAPGALIEAQSAPWCLVCRAAPMGVVLVTPSTGDVDFVSAPLRPERAEVPDTRG